eukprot:10167691-Heterocapsa_arctica.AAC.1
MVYGICGRDPLYHAGVRLESLRRQFNIQNAQPHLTMLFVCARGPRELSAPAPQHLSAVPGMSDAGDVTPVEPMMEAPQTPPRASQADAPFEVSQMTQPSPGRTVMRDDFMGFSFEDSAASRARAHQAGAAAEPTSVPCA